MIDRDCVSCDSDQAEQCQPDSEQPDNFKLNLNLNEPDRDRGSDSERPRASRTSTHKVIFKVASAAALSVENLKSCQVDTSTAAIA
eukprot:439124-Rhodomonas_salina.2